MYKTISDRQPQPNTMTLLGNAHVTAIPDTAVIRLGVQTTGENLAEAQAENARLSQAVIDTLNRLGVNNLQTFQYTIDKQYDFQNGARIDRGYSVRNIMEIRMSNIEQAGAVIDAAVESGANVVELISFEVSSTDLFYRQALNLAIRNAIQKAKSISSNLGVPINPVPIQITENSAMPIPFSQMFTTREALATPIEPGDKRIEASVTVEFAY